MSRPDPLDQLGLSLRTGAAELFLVRHADAVPAADAPAADYVEYEVHPLSARGRAQAEAVAEHLAGVGLASVYTSPVRRARETADAIAAAAGVDVREEPGVTEIAIGAGDGATGGTMSLAERLAWLATVAMRDGSWNGIAGTEPSDVVRTRMMRALDAIAARHPGARVAIVSHAGAINAALAVLAASEHNFLFPIANASVSVVRIGGGRRLLMSANETGHLSAIPSRARA